MPQLSLPHFLKNQGYRTEGVVSLPVLNPMTSLSAHFDRYELAPSHNDLARHPGRRRGFPGHRDLAADEPGFYFINTGETHYPYLLPGETGEDLPHISGVHGVFKHLDDFLKNPSEFLEGRKQDEFFTPEQFQAFYEKQIACVEHLDGVVGQVHGPLPGKHLLHDHVRPRGTVRRGRLLRPRPHLPREGLRGVLPGGKDALVRADTSWNCSSCF